jgi:hypothetical protein
MYVCIRYKSVLGYACMCEMQVSDWSCMYVSDTRRVIGHVSMCQILSCIITIEINKSINNMIDVNVLLWC